VLCITQGERGQRGGVGQNCDFFFTEFIAKTHFCTICFADSLNGGKMPVPWGNTTQGSLKLALPVVPPCHKVLRSGIAYIVLYLSANPCHQFDLLARS